MHIFVENGLRYTKYCGRATYAHYILWSRGLLKEYKSLDPNARVACARVTFTRFNSALPEKICCTTHTPKGTIWIESDVQIAAWQPIGRRLVKRKIRRVIEIALPVAGMGIIFLAVLFGPDSLQIQVLMVLLGILTLEAGVWGLASRLLPDERRDLGLRSEVDYFIGLIPELNAAALARQVDDGGAENKKRFPDILEQLHSSVGRMGKLAGQDVKAEKAEN